VNATVPAGDEAVPTPAVSFTNAVQLVACTTMTADGEHDTVVVVALLLTVTVLLIPAGLVVCTPSVGL